MIISPLKLYQLTLDDGPTPTETSYTGCAGGGVASEWSEGVDHVLRLLTATSAATSLHTPAQGEGLDNKNLWCPQDTWVGGF